MPRAGKRCSTAAAPPSARLSEADKADIDRAKALRLMGANPSLIRRPVVEHAGGVLVGFDAGEWEATF